MSASLSDDEFATITIEDQVYTLETYNALLAILDARELVSGTRDRLRYYFLARDVDVSESSPGKSNILLGGCA